MCRGLNAESKACEEAILSDVLPRLSDFRKQEVHEALFAGSDPREMDREKTKTDRDGGARSWQDHGMHASLTQAWSSSVKFWLWIDGHFDEHCRTDR